MDNQENLDNFVDNINTSDTILFRLIVFFVVSFFVFFMFPEISSWFYILFFILGVATGTIYNVIFVLFVIPIFMFS